MQKHNLNINKNAEKASITAEFFKTLLMNANVWITFLDPKGCIVVWNKAAEEISGYTADEVMESNEIWKKLYPDPEYRKVVTKKINDTLQNRKKLENFETIILTKGALKKQISWNTREILDQNGDIIGYIAMGRDITEIVSLGKQFRTLLMNANVWVAFLDPQSKIEVWNRAAEEISGYTADEVIGSNEIWKKLYPDQEYRKELTEKIIDIISNKKSLTNFESNIVTKNKEKRVISWNTREIRDDENKIMGFVATGRDITNIINLQRKFGTLLMNANVGIAFLDPQSRIEVWNRAAEEISGYTADEVIGSNEVWKKLYPEQEYREKLTEKIIDIISNKKSLENFESRIITRDGDKKTISWNTRELEDEKGNTLGYIIIGLDITKEKKMHTEVFEYIGESAMRLKNPVEVIKNNMDGLIMRLEEGDHPTEDLILQIRIQSKNAEKIIENLHELNEAVSMAFEDMPPALKKFLSG